MMTTPRFRRQTEHLPPLCEDGWGAAATRPLPSRLALSLALGLFVSSGLLACTVVDRSQEAGPDLVSKDAPVYDQTFRDVDPGDLDPRRLWKDADEPGSLEPVSLHRFTVADLSERVSPAVVNLYTTSIEAREARIGVHPNELLPFRLPIVSGLLDFVPFKVPIPFRTQGFSLGSGFLIHPEGFVLTNAHVVRNATDVLAVRLGGSEEVPARIIGTDPLTDSALLKIPPPSDGAFLPLADSDSIRVGEFVVAIGNPLGLTHSVTVGVVSAVERIVPIVDSTLLDFIQTDTAINPGNSGGPLLNLRGEVIGINTAIASQAQSIGFVVPINTVKQVMPLLVLNRPERGWLGLEIVPLLGTKRDPMLTDRGQGVSLAQVVEGSPADLAGLKVGDRVLTINEVSIDGPVALRRSIVAVQPGDRIVLRVLRQETLFDVEVELGEPPKKRR